MGIWKSHRLRCYLGVHVTSLGSHRPGGEQEKQERSAPCCFQLEHWSDVDA